MKRKDLLSSAEALLRRASNLLNDCDFKLGEQELIDRACEVQENLSRTISGLAGVVAQLSSPIEITIKVDEMLDSPQDDHSKVAEEIDEEMYRLSDEVFDVIVLPHEIEKMQK